MVTPGNEFGHVGSALLHRCYLANMGSSRVRFSITRTTVWHRSVGSPLPLPWSALPGDRFPKCLVGA